jgi:hypothetical protein
VKYGRLTSNLSSEIMRSLFDFFEDAIMILGVEGAIAVFLVGIVY